MSTRVEEEADDYMSDVLLEKCGDFRPGVVSKSVAKRYKKENEQYENNLRQKRQKLHVVEREVREEALAKPISSDNKGFAMLSKMGYKPGMALGKPVEEFSINSCKDEEASSSSSTSNYSKRLKEPISIDLKTDRKGLGHSIVSKEKLAALEGVRKAIQIKHRLLQNDYESKHRETVYSKTVRKNLYDSQKACFELDSRSNITQPEVDWYWPAQIGVDNDEDTEESEETDIEDDISDSDKLVILTTYLRTTYYYCLWCGTTYENLDDLSGNCPGDSKEAHDDECCLSNDA